MPRLCETDGLTVDQTEILKAVRTFVEEKILPVATQLEHADDGPVAPADPGGPGGGSGAAWPLFAHYQ